MRCGTCKHWVTREEDSEDYFEHLRICHAVPHLLYKDHKTRGPAGVVDGSDYYAAFHTADDFSCSLWEAS